jgi:hypothetical protein
VSKPIIAVHTITQEDARNVVGFMGQAPHPTLSSQGAPERSSFREALIIAITAADEYNLDRLARGYEGLVSAVRVYRELPDGLAQLRLLGWPGPF